LIAGSIDVMFVQRLHRQQFAAELAVAAGASLHHSSHWQEADHAAL
jgi:hypothetical protein